MSLCARRFAELRLGSGWWRLDRNRRGPGIGEERLGSRCRDGGRRRSQSGGPRLGGIASGQNHHPGQEQPIWLAEPMRYRKRQAQRTACHHFLGGERREGFLSGTSHKAKYIAHLILQSRRSKQPKNSLDLPLISSHQVRCRFHETILPHSPPLGTGFAGLGAVKK